MLLTTAHGVQFEVWNDGCGPGLFSRAVELFEEALAALSPEDVEALHRLASADLETRVIRDPKAIERLEEIANRPLVFCRGVRIMVGATP